MPQISLRHSHYIYSNHSDNKLITLFCNQFATTPPKNPVFSGISSVFLLFPLDCGYSTHINATFFKTIFSLFLSILLLHLFSALFHRTPLYHPQLKPELSLHHMLLFSHNLLHGLLYYPYLTQ